MSQREVYKVQRPVFGMGDLLVYNKSKKRQFLVETNRRTLSMFKRGNSFPFKVFVEAQIPDEVLNSPATDSLKMVTLKELKGWKPVDFQEW